MRYESKTDELMGQAFSEQTGLPAESLPPGSRQVNIKPTGMIDINQPEGRVDTYYPSTTGGQLDLFGKAVPEKGGFKPEYNHEVDLDNRIETSRAAAHLKYQANMMNAGFVMKDGKFDPSADPVLAQYAAQKFTQDMMATDLAEANARNAFKQIDEEPKVGPNEKTYAKQQYMEKFQDPVYFNMGKQEQRGFSPKQLNIKKGQFNSLLNKTDNTGMPIYNSMEDALYGVGSAPGIYQIFGEDAETTVPEMFKLIQQKFATKKKAPASPVASTNNATQIKAPPKGYVWMVKDGKGYTISEAERNQALKEGYLDYK